MPYQIGLKLWSSNTGAYRKEALRLYDEGLYDYIELYVVPDTPATLSQWKELKHVPFIIHNPHFKHGFNLAKAENKSYNLSIYSQSRQFADELNARYLIFHGGIDGSAEECARQLASLREERALIENKPFIALPNRMGGSFCRGATRGELQMIMSVAQCGFCFDIGHAICSANSQRREPYAFLRALLELKPSMFHLSDVKDMASPYDAHPHLGTGKLDIARLKREIFPDNALISIETDKDSKEDLNDFTRDVNFLRTV